MAATKPDRSKCEELGLNDYSFSEACCGKIVDKLGLFEVVSEECCEKR